MATYSIIQNKNGIYIQHLQSRSEVYKAIQMDLMLNKYKGAVREELEAEFKYMQEHRPTSSFILKKFQ